MEDADIPRVRIKEIVEFQGVRLLKVDCPFCGKVHTHGGGYLDDDWEQFLGYRVSHCGGNGYFNDTYCLIADEE